MDICLIKYIFDLIRCVLQKSYNSGQQTDIMLRDDTKQDDKNELESVIFELKMELAG